MRPLICDIFDPDRGWKYSHEDLPVREHMDGEIVYYVAELYGIEMVVYQATNPWGEDWPNLVVVAATLTGVTHDSTWLLACNSFAFGLPSIGVDEHGQITVQASFPISPNFPSYLARKQVVTCLGMVANRVSELLQPEVVLDFDSLHFVDEAPQSGGGSGMGEKAARLAGILFGSMIKEGFRDD